MTAGLLDQEARDRIVGAHDANLFVDAGAGSGKTKQLVDRVVSMVACRYLKSVSGLAAITFTENAATELRTRIREALETASSETGSSETGSSETGSFETGSSETGSSETGRTAQEQARCSLALTELDDAAITTLHGFAARLLTDAPMEAGLPPGFRVQDAIRASIDSDAWWRCLLDDWYGDETLADVWRAGLTLDLNPAFLKEVLASFDGNWDLLAGRPIAMQPMPALNAEALLRPLRRLVAYAGGKGPGADRLTDRIDRVLTPLLREASAESDPLQVLAVLRGTPLKDAGNAGAWTKAGLDKATACAFLGEARAAVDAQLTACRAAVTTTLAERLRQAVLGHAAARRDRGELWFHDLLVYAVRLLRDDNEVRAAVRERWPVICVDEFQDTDPLQVELVHLIAGLDEGSWADAAIDGGRLFFVGDPKQSIYRFRRAEVGLFAQVRDRYDGGRLTLVQNFRSRPGVLQVINELFGRLLGDDPATGYDPLHAARQAVAGDPGPDVLLVGGPSAQRISEIREAEADHIASTLARARGSWLTGGTPETSHPASFGDMAILVPARTSLGQLEDALGRYAVPYRIMSRSLIWESDTVRDLITVLQAIDDPADPVALVAALRHPMFGCSDDDLVAWKLAGGTWRYDTSPVRDAAESPVADAMAALRRYHDLRWWLPVNILLDRIIRERRAVELTAAHRRPRDHWRRLRFLTDQARMFLDNGGGGLTSFVRWALEQIDRAADAIETVTPERDDDAVAILTIHGSKGLEFPIVALTGINTPPLTRGQVIWPADGPPEITLHKEFKTPGFTAAQQAEKVLDQQEQLRLLYVGMTRAEDHLIVSIHHHPPQHGRPDTHAMRLSQMLPALEAAGAACELAGRPVPAGGPGPAAATDGASAEARRRFLTSREELLKSAVAGLPTTATGLAETAAGESQEPADPLEAAAAGDAAEPVAGWPAARSGTTLGSTVHRALEILDLAQATGRAVDHAVTAACAELGIPQLAGEVRSRVQAALTAQIVQLAATRRHWKEVPVVAELGGRVVEGFIDLVVETDAGLVVVDYKTDSVPSAADIQAKAQHYAPQIRAYAQALALATGLRIAPPQLLFCQASSTNAVTVSLPALRAAYRHLSHSSVTDGLFPMRELPAWPDEMAGVAVGITLEVVLMLRLRCPERPSRLHLGDHLSRPQARGVDIRDRVVRDPLLLVVGVENGRPVAEAGVVALAVLRGRVVYLEEELQKVTVGDLPGVEDDLDRLSVGPVIPVRRVGYVPARVADPRGQDARAAADEVLHSPETSAGQNRLLGRLAHRCTSPSASSNRLRQAGVSREMARGSFLQVSGISSP
jgi:ATP-dependent helicase/nuclease subunit A